MFGLKYKEGVGLLRTVGKAVDRSSNPKERVSLRALPLWCGFSFLFGSCRQAEFLILCRQHTTPLLASPFSGFCQRLLPS